MRASSTPQAVKPERDGDRWIAAGLYRFHAGSYDLQVLEPVAAPRDFPMRFAWSSRYATDPGNTWLRETVIAAYGAHEADITRRLREAAIPLGG